MEEKVRELLESMAEDLPGHPSIPGPTERRARRGMAYSVLTGALVIGLAAYGGVAGIRALSRPVAPPPRPASQVSCEWTRVPSPNEDPGTFTNRLGSVAVAGEDDVWAAGGYYHPAGEASGPERPLVLHWDGIEWRIAALPNLSGARADVAGLVAVSPSDVWAVGSTSLEDGTDLPLALHWDGAAWTEVPTPDPGERYSHLSAVDAVGPGDLWAVGNWATGDGAAGTLAMHWDGSGWTIVPTPDPPPRPQVGWSYPGLEAVAALGPEDVWAVGTSSNVAPAGPSNTLALHWDGKIWSLVLTPDIPSRTGDPFDTLGAVATGSPDDIWAVGSYGLALHDDSSGLPERTLAAHWDGASWSVTPTPEIEGRNSLTGVSALSSSDAWAVGETQIDAAQHALLERWDGAAWTVVPPPLDDEAWLSAVAATPSGDLWAVGSVRIPNSENWQTLVLRAVCG